MNNKINPESLALAEAKREAESLALSLWKRHYKDDAPDWGLCDSVAGVITQIDNMSAGLGVKVEEQQQTIETLREALMDAANNMISNKLMDKYLAIANKFLT